jgi:hypothetical protein
LAVQDDRFEYYKIIFVYVDDVLTLSRKPKVLIDSIGEYYKVKPGSDKEPDIYLGANIEKVQMPDRREVWASSHCDYVRRLLRPLRVYLKKMVKATY